MSVNISKIRREQLLQKIEEIRLHLLKNAPNPQLEDYLLELASEIKNRKFGLVFEKHREKIDDLMLTHLPVLTEDKELTIDNGGQWNFLIEGDNLPALELLLKTHKGKIDLIYIDPPYNTKSKDFIYDDSYVDPNDTFKHSKWLSFMEKRLNLAHQLLKPEGCIFISINEEEQAQLKILCDQIFGESNYLTMFSVKVRHEDRILKGDKDFHEVIEYLLLYRKSPLFKTVKRILDNTSIDDYVYKVIEKESNPDTVVLDGKTVSVFKPGQYEIKKVSPDLSNLKKINIRGSIKEGNSSGRFFMKHFNKYIGEQLGYLYKVPNMGGDGLGFRYFLLPDKPSRTNGDYFQGVPVNRGETKEIPFPNFLDFEYAFNNVGYEGEVEFRNGKKPMDFINKCFEMGGIKRNKNSIVLDFFAGSGSTGHSLMELNKADNGNRRFILVTNNENNICRNVTYERLKRVIEKENYQASLKYYRVDFINTEGKVYYEYADELLKHIRELVQLENGVDLNSNEEFAIVLTDEEMDEFVQNLPKRSKPCRKLYVGHDVLPDPERERELIRNGIEIVRIPDYYYSERRG
ncbi:site-specific DNA-methyltransferase [Clostridium colicanis]|uniref:Putative methyltransferase n=1 Tax=Clostridium colicanis DSM 13634 TaxID=1121305 RepID=A0A151AM49_9CLOT|nr:site-specific DNA-methyltransferase [Clostridium colicanis]KYH28703.1 putative methyltransferase [Clostridium colicanis DSM 13634]